MGNGRDVDAIRVDSRDEGLKRLGDAKAIAQVYELAGSMTLAEIELSTAENLIRMPDPRERQIDTQAATATEGRTIEKDRWLAANRSGAKLYRVARDLVNVQATSKGPTSYGKRVVRRKVNRTTNGINRRVLKDLGL